MHASRLLGLVALLPLFAAAACTTPAGGDDDGPDDDDSAPQDDDSAPAVPEFGTDETRVLTVIATAADGLDVPRDLEFRPAVDNQLWTVNRAFDGVVIFRKPGTAEQEADVRIDVYGNHFMEEVSSVAFGADDTFATCQESRNTYDGHGAPDDFMGPALWPADPDVFAEINQNNNLLGSHLDMLHESPLCMGIAWDHDNVYWAFDGKNGDIVYYDFQQDHGYGHDDHSDGIVRRYVDVNVERVPDVPSNLVLDPASGWLYFVNTVGGKVRRLDTATGEVTGSLPETMEPLGEYSKVEDAVVEVFAEGLVEPSGIELGDGRLFVTDYATGEVVAFDLGGAELGRIQTDAQGIMGITLGPDGKLWYVDALADEVVRVDP